MIKATIFDKDGTLFDLQATWGHWTGAVLSEFCAGDDDLLNRLALALGYDLDAAQLRPGSLVIAGTPAQIVRVVMDHVDTGKEGEVLDRLNRLAADAPQVEILPLAAFFDQLREMGLKTAVMTNDAEAPAKAHLAHVLDKIDMIVGSDSGHGAKPDPDPLLAIAAHLGVDPKHCVMIGDSTHDLGAGRAAGMKSLAVLTGLATKTELAPLADAVLMDIRDVPDWITTYSKR